MTTSASLPYPGTYWVVSGSLLAGAYPGNGDPAEMDRRLNALLDAGIRSVIYLVDESVNEDDADNANVGDMIEPLQALRAL